MCSYFSVQYLHTSGEKFTREKGPARNILRGKVHFTPSNFRQSSDFNLELQNRITLALQLLKKFNFQPSVRFRLWTVTFDIFGGAEILYYFFKHLNVLKWKNSKLQSCRSHWELQLWYKKYFTRDETLISKNRKPFNMMADENKFYM